MVPNNNNYNYKNIVWVVLGVLARADQRGDVKPHREDVTGVRVDVHGQRKLHIRSLDFMDACAVYGFDDRPNLREREVQGKAGDLT